jgi:peptidyl-prolyl cis-trans isomerase SurA
LETDDRTMPQLKSRLSCLALVILAAFAVRPAAAQDTLRIVALVNDEAITAIDVAKRTQILIASSGLENTPESYQRLQPQVVRSLIDERLRQQAADQQGINVSQDRIDERMSQLAQSNNMTLDDFRAALANNRIDPAWLEEQIRTEIAWAMLVNTRFRSTIVVTDEDIDNAQRQARERQGLTQYRVAEIFLSVDDPKDSDAVQDSAQRLIDQLKKGGDFGAVARQFSQSASAGNGGLLGWVGPGELAPEIAEAVEKLDPGTIAGPIRSDGGFHILRVLDRREVRPDDNQTRQQISDRIVRDRLDVLARGYLRDLRRTAYIDIRQ